MFSPASWMHWRASCLLKLKRRISIIIFAWVFYRRMTPINMLPKCPPVHGWRSTVIHSPSGRTLVGYSPVLPAIILRTVWKKPSGKQKTACNAAFGEGSNRATWKWVASSVVVSTAGSSRRWPCKMTSKLKTFTVFCWRIQKRRWPNWWPINTIPIIPK